MARKATKPTTRTRKPKETAAPKQVKPVFRIGTLVTLIVFAAVIGAAYYITQNPIETEDAEATPTGEAVSAFSNESVVTSIEVDPAIGETVKLERNEEKFWAVTLPSEIEADQGLAEAAATQLTSLKVQTEIEGDPSIFGLDHPEYIILVQFEDGKTGKLEIGTNTPTENGYYARVDGKMVILDMQGIDALTQLVAAPPYLYTPTPTVTPSPIPTETPVPTIEATPTP